jgi:hypothetical protein
VVAEIDHESAFGRDELVADEARRLIALPKRCNERRRPEVLV